MERIRVEDRLPENGTEVIAFVDGESEYSFTCIYTDGFFDGKRNDFFLEHIEDVTHWAKLKLPNQ